MTYFILTDDQLFCVIHVHTSSDIVHLNLQVILPQFIALIIYIDCILQNHRRFVIGRFCKTIHTVDMPASTLLFF